VWRWRGAGGFGNATTTVENYKVGTLIVDLFDGKSQSLVWRGIAQDTLSNNGNKNQQTVQKGVQKMFKQWPKT